MKIKRESRNDSTYLQQPVLHLQLGEGKVVEMGRVLREVVPLPETVGERSEDGLGAEGDRVTGRELFR